MPDITIKTDAAARARAAAVLPSVQDKVPAADLDYVYTCAARVGATRVCSTHQNREITAEDLAEQTGVDVEDTIVTIDEDLEAQLQAKADALALPIEQVLGAAVVSGLAFMAGVDPGPFTSTGVSRQFIRPFTV